MSSRVGCALGLAVGLALAAPSAARAQAPTLIVVPADTTPEVREALRVELQLSGRAVVFVTVAEEDEHTLGALAAQAGAEVIALERHADGVDFVRVGPGTRGRDRAPSDAPRAIALLAIALLEQQQSSVAARAETETVEPRVHASELAEESARVAAGLDTPRVPAREPPAAPLPPIEERVGFELLGSVLLGGGLGVAGALIAEAAGADGDFPWWAAGLAIGGTVGSALGAWIAGRLTGADGDPFWTLAAGLAAGALSGLLLFAGQATDTSPTDGVTSGWVYLGAVAAAVLPPAASILAFELSVPARQSPRLVVQVGPTGLAGAF